MTIEPTGWDYTRELRVRGYRLTPQRQLIIDTLHRLEGHVSAGAVYAAVHALSPAVDRATVYRTLHLFEELGVVVSAEINGQTLYELAQAAPHHHLVCTACGEVRSLSHTHLHTLIDHLETEHGFQAHPRHLTIPGLCQRCHSPVGQQSA